MLLGWAALPARGLLLAVLPGPWLLVAGQAVSGISAAVFGVMLPLLAADITRGSSHFNLCMGLLGLAMYIGAALSTTLGGWIADSVSLPVAFCALAAVGLAGTTVVWTMMPETRGASV
jgi:MFS family permease